MTSSLDCSTGPAKAEAQPAVKQQRKIGLAQMPILILMKAAENAAKLGLATITKEETSWTVVIHLNGMSQSQNAFSEPSRGAGSEDMEGEPRDSTDT